MNDQPLYRHIIFNWINNIFLVIYLLVKFKIINTPLFYEYLLEDFLKLIVVFFCITLFSPFRKVEVINHHDRIFGFSAGIFLLLSLQIVKNNSYLNAIIDRLNDLT
jgi:hypothetical protein